MYRLIVKDFGPLKDIDIELNRINIFIGENGSGKSVLAKLIDTIFELLALNKDNFFERLRYYNIDYTTDNTIIKLIKNNNFSFELINNRINFSKKDKEFINSKYIPAERNLISLFNRYLSTFITAEIPLPKFLLNFSSDYIKAREEFRELEFLNIKYINSTEDRIYYSNNRYLKLEHSSSGIQSALPLYLTLKYYAQKRHSVIIEEPEQNLFPKAQKETVEFIIENINQNSSLYLMTHSPYILTSINNLILANDVRREKGDSAIEGIVKKEHCIDFDEVSAYFIDKGRAIDIKNYENRLINATFIDSISDEIDDEFDLLLSKLD